MFGNHANFMLHPPSSGNTFQRRWTILVHDWYKSDGVFACYCAFGAFYTSAEEGCIASTVLVTDPVGDLRLLNLHSLSRHRL